MARRSEKPGSPTGGGGEGRFAYDGLDRVIHERARLGLMTSLAGRPDGLTFVELKDLCRLTDGNLSRHLKVLEEAGLIELWKRGRPDTADPGAAFDPWPGGVSSALPRGAGAGRAGCRRVTGGRAKKTVSCLITRPPGRTAGFQLTRPLFLQPFTLQYKSFIGERFHGWV